MTSFIFVTYRARWDDETHQYEAFCEELDVATCADDLDGAFAGIKQATELYLNEIEETGERPRIFQERGITFQTEEAPAELPPITGMHLGDFVTSASLPIPARAA